MANGGEPAVPSSPDAFRQGMFVLHEVYGLGQIIALSGSGTESQGDRRFRSAGGSKEIPAGRKRAPTGRNVTGWKPFVAADDDAASNRIECPHVFHDRPRAGTSQLPVVLLRPGRFADRHVDAADRLELAGMPSDRTPPCW